MNDEDYILVGYNKAIPNCNWPNNNSLRGLYSSILQEAWIYGKSSTSNLDAFRPEFIYSHINEINDNPTAPPKPASAQELPKKQPKQVIIYGAPGTGKSQGLKGKSNTRRITFHPDVDYASFVGCYKPTSDFDESTSREEIRYSFVPQTFFKIYVDAWNHLDQEYNLLIEEINRGNCAQIFGDIFQLLDRNEQGFSDYPIEVDSDMWKELEKWLPDYYCDFMQEIYKDSQGEGFTGVGCIALPNNLNIIATMNTSDNSLYRMDSAFKRRWDWEYTPINYVEPKLTDVALAISGLSNNNWLKILERINQFIKKETQSTAKQIGQWFVIPDKLNGSYVKISFKTFRDKVMFYLFNDVFKDTDCLKDIISPNEDTYLFEDMIMSSDGGEQKCKVFIEFILKD